MTEPEHRVDAPADVLGVLRALERQGDRPALSFYRGRALEARVSYAQLIERVAALAEHLHGSLGVRAGDRVAVLTPNRVEVPGLVLALLRLGAAVVPLNPGAALEDWVYAIRHSGARGLCATRELAARLSPADRPGFVLDLEVAPPQRSSSPLPSGEDLSDRVAVVLYTSGTTGQPKGVALRQRNVIANAQSMAKNFALAATTQLAVLPLYHAHAFGFGLMTALGTGGHLVFTSGLDPFTWADVIRAESVEVTSVVPTFLPLLLAAGVTADRVPTLRHLLVSSAPLPSTLAREFEARTRLRLVQGWGLSEYTNFACCMPPRASPAEHERLMTAREVPSVGPALEGTQVRVVAADGAAAEEGARGELQVRGHSTMQGYLDDPAGTARTLGADGWLRTGDEGFFHVEGGQRVFFVSGRLKEIIVRDADKYSPARLELRLLEALPELAGRLVVLGFPHRVHGEEIGLYVAIEALPDATRARLVDAIAMMSAAERPKVVLHGARAIPRTHTGKIQRLKMQPWFARWNGHRGGIVVEALPCDEGPVSS